MPEAFQVSLVVQRIQIADQHQGQQSPHDRCDIQLMRKSKAPHELRGRQRSQRGHQKNYDRDGIPPEPGSAAIQAAQGFPDLPMIGDLRFWLL